MSEWQPAPLQEMNMDLEEMIGRAADRASDVGLLPDESYEDFDSRRAVAIGKAVLSCLEENGMVVVPREPTEEMVDAGKNELAGFDWVDGEKPIPAKAIWRDMLAAAPKQ
jgi:hypothetical protein